MIPTICKFIFLYILKFNYIFDIPIIQNSTVLFSNSIILEVLIKGKKGTIWYEYILKRGYSQWFLFMKDSTLNIKFLYVTNNSTLNMCNDFYRWNIPP